MQVPPPEQARSYRPLEPARLAVVAIAVPLACFLGASIAALVAMQMLGIDARDPGDGGAVGAAMELVFASSTLLFEALLLALTLAVASKRETPWTGRSIAWTPWPKDRSLLPFLVLMLVWQMVEGFLIEPRFPQLTEVTRLPQSQPAVLLSLATMAVAAVAEESFFRGLLYTNLRAHAGFPMTIIVTSAYFALMHFDSSLALPLLALPFGLIAGLARERYGSVRPAIYLHLIWNLTAFGIDYFQIGAA